MWRKVLAGLALLAVWGGPAWAIPDEDWAFFRAESYGKSGSMTGKTDWESRLYRALTAGPDSDAILQTFAADIGVSPERAEMYAEALILSVRFREGCGDACDIRAGSPDWETIARAARADPSGQLLAEVGENTGSWGPADNRIGLLRLIQAHPARLDILLRLHAYNEDAPFLAPMVMTAPGDPRVVEAVAWAGANLREDPDIASGWMDAALEWGLRQLEAAGAGAADRAVYTQTILLRRLETGRIDEAVAMWRGLDPALQDIMPAGGAACASGSASDRHLCLRRAAYDRFGDEMAAALWGAGHRDEAEALLKRITLHLADPADRTGAQRHAAILDAMFRTRPPEALFDLYVDGDPTVQGKSARVDFVGDESAWISSDFGTASRPLIVARARDAGYGAIAAALDHQTPYYRSQRDDGEDMSVLPHIADTFPTGVSALQPAAAAAIDAAWFDRRPELVPSSRNPLPSALPAGWTEQPLSAGVAAWPADREPEPLPEGMVLPVDADAVVRHEVVEGEHAILYLSSDFDLPGETPAYGLWLVRTVGGRWTPPVYLGLQNYFPYVATAGSALPLIADGRLQIEVRVREIATRSISFPPVGLSIARREDGVFISVPLSVVEHDGDADGLTDIAERRLGLNPDGADTDGDGLIDGSDPLPLTRFDPATPATVTAFARVLLAKIAEGAGPGNMLEPTPEGATAAERFDAVIGSPPHPALHTMIIQGDPALFAGLSPDFRLMVYGEGELDRLTEATTPFYPPEMTIYSSLDGLNHYVVWSARWVGGSFAVRCPANGEVCTVREKSNWIT